MEIFNELNDEKEERGEKCENEERDEIQPNNNQTGLS